MIIRRISLTVFLVLCVLCVAQGVYYYPLLPERVASHFGLSGQPDAWSTKTSFVTFYFIITGFVTLLFLGIRFGMSKIPSSLINMPNKDYWLSPERKQETFDFMSHYFLWFASATLLLMLAMFHQTFQVNLGRANGLSHPMLSIGLYIGFSVLWTIGLVRRFGKKSVISLLE
jgi:uncharacterized membrane protein